jgi:hypothetical protein
VSAPGFFDTLEAQLGDGLERTVRRRAARRRMLERGAGLAVALIAISAAVLFVNGRDVAEAGVSVETEGGLVYIRLTDVEYRPDVIEDAAGAAGLDVSVRSVPTGPSLVGRFVGFTEEGEGAGLLKELNADGASFTGFVLPSGYDGSLHLEVGRPAKDGEPYEASTNALSEHEPLACTGILGASAPDAVAIVSDRSATAQWMEQVGSNRRLVDERDVRQRDDLHVVQATATSSTHVLVVLAADGVTIPSAGETAPAAC